MSLKQLTAYLGIVLFITSCYKFKETEKPKDLISKDMMVNIIIDVKLLATADAEAKRIMKEHGIKREKYIYAKYNVDSLQFARSNDYYTFRLKEYEEIYERVKDSLQQLKIIYKELDLKEEKEKEEKRKTDSVNAIIKEKDSIKRIKLKDSLKVVFKNDSIVYLELKKIFEEGEEGEIILPVSDIDSLSQ